MILNTTLKSIRVVLGEATTTNECDITASWGDYAGTQFVPGSADDVTNGTTPVTIVGAPGTSEQRLVQEITVYNRDTVSHTVILQLLNNATVRVFRHQEIPVDGMLVYSPSSTADVVNASAAVLLESGTLGAKISALPAFSLTTPPVGSEKLPVVEAGATDAITLAQLYTLFTAWLDFIATNPLDAAGSSGDGGLEVFITAGAGDGVGDGGAFVMRGGAGGDTGSGGALGLRSGGGGATSGNGGALTVTAGDAGASGGGGAITVTSGAGAGSGAGGNLSLSSGTGGGSSGTGGAMSFSSGDGGSPNGAGGLLNFGAGSGVGTGAGGALHVTSGQSGSGATGASGVATFASGRVFSTDGDSGSVTISSANATGTGAVGVVQITAGNSGGGATGDGGGITLTSGNSAATDGNGGDITISTGNLAGAGRIGLVIWTGNVPNADPLVSGALWVDPVTHLVHLSP